MANWHQASCLAHRGQRKAATRKSGTAHGHRPGFVGSLATLTSPWAWLLAVVCEL